MESKKYILESVGCGCAFIDYDNDGWMDIFLLCGTRLEGAPAGATNRLYKNNRDGTFTDVTEKAGLHAVGWASGVCVGDYNNDGFEDIFCTYFGHNKLYRNNGDGTFSDVTEAAGLLGDPTRWGAGCSFLDCNRSGHLDLFVSNYVHFDLQPCARSWSELQLQLEGNSRGVRADRPSYRTASTLPKQRRRHLYRRQRKIGHRQGHGVLWHDRGCRGL
jgi:hypothetical protein